MAGEEIRVEKIADKITVILTLYASTGKDAVVVSSKNINLAFFTEPTPLSMPIRVQMCCVCQVESEEGS